MPVGTVGSVKAVHQRELREDIDAQIILGNTYHLYLRPGTDVLQKLGGLHRFMQWNRPILTDSGGYQVYSLTDRRKLTEEGAKFSSHIDGSKHIFTPEKVIDIQRAIGSIQTNRAAVWTSSGLVSHRSGQHFSRSKSKICGVHRFQRG
jgi:queuine tRNA-ribosyltransferase